MEKCIRCNLTVDRCTGREAATRTGKRSIYPWHIRLIESVGFVMQVAEVEVIHCLRCCRSAGEARPSSRSTVEVQRYTRCSGVDVFPKRNGPAGSEVLNRSARLCRFCEKSGGRKVIHPGFRIPNIERHCKIFLLQQVTPQPANVRHLQGEILGQLSGNGQVK